MSTAFLKAGTRLIPISSVTDVDMTEIENGRVTVFYNGQSAVADSFDAIEIVMLLKPSALEGKRLRWQRNVWAFHNFIAHPLMQILVWLGFKKQAIRLHDATVPKPAGFREKLT